MGKVLGGIYSKAGSWSLEGIVNWGGIWEQHFGMVQGAMEGENYMEK